MHLHIFQHIVAVFEKFFYSEQPSAPVDYDAIIVPGCLVLPTGIASEGLTKRVSKCVELFDEGKAKSVIFTGQPPRHGLPSEAEVMRRVAIELGIPNDVIVLEEASSNSWDNVKNTVFIMDRLNLDVAVLVTSPFHLKRMSCITRYFNKTIIVVAAFHPSEYPYLKRIKLCCYEFLALIKLLITIIHRKKAW